MEACKRFRLAACLWELHEGASEMCKEYTQFLANHGQHLGPKVVDKITDIIEEKTEHMETIQDMAQTLVTDASALAKEVQVTA